MGVGSAGAEALAFGGEEIMTKIVLHTALDVGGTAVEEKHLKHEHRKEQEAKRQNALLATVDAKLPLIEEWLSGLASSSKEYWKKATTSPRDGPRAPSPASDMDIDTILSGLQRTIDGMTLTQLESELERAVEEMDNTASLPFDQMPVASKRASRTFESPADIDNIFNRYSRQYNDHWSQYSAVPSCYSTDQSPVQPGNPPRRWSDQKQTGIDPFMLEHHPSLQSHTTQDPPSYYEPYRKGSGEDHDQIPPSYHEPCRKGSGEGYEQKSPSNFSQSSSSATSSHTLQPSLSRTPSPTSSPSSTFSGPSASRTTTATSVESSSSQLSTTSSFASSMSSAHSGLKKTGYLGMGTATKLAVGGSLCLVGVRPSVQRKMFDNVKGKMRDRMDSTQQK